MTAKQKTLVNRLLKAPAPSVTEFFEPGDNPYDAARLGISNDEIPGLIEIARQWTNADGLSGLGPDVDSEAAGLLPVTAWRVLGSLKAAAAVGPLIEILCETDEEADDWAPEVLPDVFGEIGEASLDPLMQIVTDQARPELIRSTAARGLGCLAESHPHMRGRVVERLTKVMANADGDHIEFNSMLLDTLVALKATEAAEPIERAFAANYLDVGVCGDWECVRKDLGVNGLGLTMPEHPYNSIEEFRIGLGIGVFSDRRVFDEDGECDPDAEEEYYERAEEAFSSSSEGEQVVRRYGSLGWYQSLLEFGIAYRGEIVDEMTSFSVQEFIQDHVPRKVTTAPKSAGAIIGELIAFWEFLDRVHELPAARSILEWLKTDGRVADLEADLSDSSNFGMAKSLFTMGDQAGFDMTSEAGINSFMQAYNQSFSQVNTPPSRPPGSTPSVQLTRDVRAGRNDPCPCGSGKKFKKCCGGSH